MREIKFRAWNKRRRFLDSAWMIDFEHGEVCHSKHNASDINACVLMQFTGLKDKNGKDIYEGDIVKIYNISYRRGSYYEPEDYEGYCVGEVHYVPSKGFVLRKSFFHDTVDGDNVIKELCYPNQRFSSSKSEVIGNVYENPELLEASHDT